MDNDFGFKIIKYLKSSAKSVYSGKKMSTTKAAKAFLNT
ncbi:hypothetical protein SAMN05421594_2462 [Chryseobacterium oleae]|uniref:Uncharacterized protein n=1 Tax=Chryseobacterium oleae TaxID=491207 RepID=A0A1I4YKJ6_CHROL|nr:hypothetical protein SAMN05421594_2462 [Chryseobacterium oleae]